MDERAADAGELGERVGELFRAQRTDPLPVAHGEPPARRPDLRLDFVGVDGHGGEVPLNGSSFHIELMTNVHELVQY